MTKQHGGTRKGAGRKKVEGKRVVTVTVSTGPLRGMSGKEVRAAAEWAVLNGWNINQEEEKMEKLSEKMEEAILTLASGGHSTAREDYDGRTVRGLIQRGLVHVWGGQGLSLTPAGEDVARELAPVR